MFGMISVEGIKAINNTLGIKFYLNKLFQDTNRRTV